MDNTKQLLETIESIYTASGNLSGWDYSISKITSLVNGKASAYLLVDGYTLHNEITALSGFSKTDLEAYQGPNGARKDVRFEYLHNLVPGKVFREFEFVTDRKAWDQSEWIQYQTEHLGCYYCMSAKISSHGLWQDYISINRLTELGQHTDKEKKDLELLLPHLARSAELHRTISTLEKQYNAVLSVLDKLLVGLLILDSKQRVVIENIAAQEIRDGTGILRLTRNSKLEAVDEIQNMKLQQLIISTIRTANGEGESDGGQLFS